MVSEDVPSVNVDTDKKKLIEKTLDDKQKDIVNKRWFSRYCLSIKNATDNNALIRNLLRLHLKQIKRLVSA